MGCRHRRLFIFFSIGLAGLRLSLSAETFRVATYNLEGYLDQAAAGRPVKSAPARAMVLKSIRALAPDVLALQEMGSVRALLELRDSLKAEGLDLPYWEHVAGFDTNIHVAVLSRFPFTARRAHTNDTFLLSGRRFRMSRGFAELDIQVSTNYLFTLLAAHLKSKRAFGAADEAELRLEEARILRQRIDTLLEGNPGVNLVVLGDFNDSKDSASTRTLIGRYKNRLVDTRPAERNGDASCQADTGAVRSITWTHYYAQDDTYSRIDFILLSPAMAREWLPDQTYVLSLPGWGLASDHRPLVAAFQTTGRQ